MHLNTPHNPQENDPRSNRLEALFPTEPAGDSCRVFQSQFSKQNLPSQELTLNGTGLFPVNSHACSWKHLWLSADSESACWSIVTRPRGLLWFNIHLSSGGTFSVYLSSPSDTHQPIVCASPAALYNLITATTFQLIHSDGSMSWGLLAGCLAGLESIQ